MKLLRKSCVVILAILATGILMENVAKALPLSHEMMDAGVRRSLSIRAIPGGIKKHVFEMEHENGCVMDSANAVYLGLPEKLAGYEIIITCADQPYSHMAIYYDRQGLYLDTLLPGLD